MKKIILIRHAKSAWDQPSLADHDRPLAERGLLAAPKMGKRLSKMGINPDRIISSTAERAKSTAQLIAKELKSPKNTIWLERDLYHASAQTMISILKSLPESIQTVILVGHNPGMNDFVDRLGGKIGNLPTAGIFAVKSSAQWKDFDLKQVDFWFFDFPKNRN
ncbi:SixA phosphatase family protein [Algoriphagus hitonicola]|uniref:Phosphohistidine phosphatase n=1 Tax=Algoriphagus hitonicola TaxID=435880 RepID=A0A1I2WYB9_9BACT|nr:histidine phosphatase family protein [Algoriphagus hitonicola]SFH06334.1 phosphohistidine phosphatase [Algoriphagus hitonicola]